jgi:hypothetical protein
LIQEWREVQGLGGLAGEIHFGVSQPGGIRRSALFRAGAPAHNWAITRLARTDDKAVPSLPLDLAGEIPTSLEVGIADLLAVVDN